MPGVSSNPLPSSRSGDGTYVHETKRTEGDFVSRTTHGLVVVTMEGDLQALDSYGTRARARWEKFALL